MTGLHLPAPARLSRADAGDLWWYFCVSEGDLGAKSNYGAMVAVLQNKGPLTSDPWAAIENAASHAMAACRHRRVEDTLRELPRAMIRVLLACHATDPKAWAGWACLGEAAGAAQFTERLMAEQASTLARLAQEETEASGGRLTKAGAQKRALRRPDAPTPDSVLNELLKQSRDRKHPGHAAAVDAVEAIAEQAQALLEAAERCYLDGKRKVGRRGS